MDWLCLCLCFGHNTSSWQQTAAQRKGVVESSHVLNLEFLSYLPTYLHTYLCSLLCRVVLVLYTRERLSRDVGSLWFTTVRGTSEYST